MRDVLFVQGGGSGAHAHWDSKLVESLRHALGPGYAVRYPRMPNEADPELATWRPILEHEIAALRPGGIVVGHSVGGTIVLSVLADAPRPAALGAIILIAAPFIGEGGWESDGAEPAAHVAARLPATVPLFLYHGEADAIVPVAHVERHAETMPLARVRRMPGRDHQLNGDLSEVASDIRALDAHAPGQTEAATDQRG